MVFLLADITSQILQILTNFRLLVSNTVTDIDHGAYPDAVSCHQDSFLWEIYTNLLFNLQLMLQSPIDAPISCSCSSHSTLARLPCLMPMTLREQLTS